MSCPPCRQTLLQSDSEWALVTLQALVTQSVNSMDWAAVSAMERSIGHMQGVCLSC